MSDDFSQAPFSRPVSVDSVGDKGLKLNFVASPEECAALAALDGLAGLRDVVVEGELIRRGREKFVARGVVKAVVTQNCVVTLDAFEQAIEEAFEVEFAPEEEAEAAYRAAMAELEAATDKAAFLAEQPDPPDPIIGGKIDIGALASEFLALGLDPYPRKPGAEFVAIVEDDAEEKPFAALAQLKKD